METIESDCNKALEDIRENIGTANAIIIEQKLWPSIQKTYKSNNSVCKKNLSFIESMILFLMFFV